MHSAAQGPLRRIVARFRTERELHAWIRGRTTGDLKRLAAGDPVLLQVLTQIREDARAAAGS